MINRVHLQRGKLLPTIVLMKLKQRFKKHNFKMAKGSHLLAFFKNKIQEMPNLCVDTEKQIFLFSGHCLLSSSFFSSQINYLNFLKLDMISVVLKLLPDSLEHWRVIILFPQEGKYTPISSTPKIYRDGSLSVSILLRIKCSITSDFILSQRRVSSISIKVDYVKEEIRKYVQWP